MEPVSVIIPTFNRAEYLRRAVLSVLSQNKFTGEIIIIDDGSTDNTSRMLQKFEKEESIIYKHIENSGPARARNIGVEIANFPLLAFLDSDDHWHSNKLVKQLDLMRHNPEFDISHTGEKWLKRGKHLNQKDIHKPRLGYIFDHCLQLCAVGMSTVIMKKKLFENMGGFDVSLPCCEDYDLWLRISRKYPFLLLAEPMTIKEGGREDQVSFQYRVGMDKFRIYAILKLLDDNVLKEDQKEKALTVLLKKCAVYGKGCIKHGRVDEGKQYLEIAKRYSD